MTSSRRFELDPAPDKVLLTVRVIRSDSTTLYREFCASTAACEPARPALLFGPHFTPTSNRLITAARQLEPEISLKIATVGRLVALRVGHQPSGQGRCTLLCAERPLAS